MSNLETFIKLKNELPSYKHIFNEIEKSEKEYIHITLKKQECTIFDSKIGGYPYLTNINDYPKNLKGECLELLAQINFEQMPHIEGFPSEGILQIFILDEEGCYGKDEDNPCLQDNFRIIYIKNISDDYIKDFSFLPKPKDYSLPFEGEGKMVFTKKSMILTAGDYRLYNLLNSEKNYILNEDEEEIYTGNFLGEGNKVGGYPHFVQNDPRHSIKEDSNFDTLLFQLDSAGENDCNVSICDYGVMDFFINNEKLKNLDFSEVLYDWSCY